MLKGFAAGLAGSFGGDGGGKGGVVISEENVFACGFLREEGKEPTCNISGGGNPLTSIMRAICSGSLSPGKMGKPVNSSARMQPKLQMSIAVVYGMASMISGAR